MRAAGDTAVLGGAGGALQSSELLAQHLQRWGGEACPDLAGVEQLASGPVVVADQERADLPCARALAFGPADNHKLLTIAQFDLEPVPRPCPRDVATLQPLSDRSLQLQLPGLLKHRAPVANLVGRHRPGGTVETERLESSSAIHVGPGQCQPTVESQQVEDHVADRDGDCASCDLRVTAAGAALLQTLKARPAGATDGNDLPVEHHPPAQRRKSS